MDLSPPTIEVELFGVPRQRAGRARLSAPARTVAELLRAIEDACPGLRGLRRADGTLSPQYLLSLDGERFLTEPDEVLPAGVRVLLLSADAGG